jgi:hypothetical protein
MVEEERNNRQVPMVLSRSMELPVAAYDIDGRRWSWVTKLLDNGPETIHICRNKRQPITALPVASASY